jgi:hypothetical protein
MTDKTALVHLKIKELEGRIFARRQLAAQAPERAWHLDYVEAYETQMRQLEAELKNTSWTMAEPVGSGEKPSAN